MNSHLRAQFSSTTLILGLVILVAASIFFMQFAHVFAGLSHSARGFAWSGATDGSPASYQGMGWISMNNISDGSGGDYGVRIPPVDGDITGYAWSGMTDENGQPGAYYGWISFHEADLAGCPVGANEQARRVGNTIVGGARILAIRDAVASGNAGGYDGCISLSGITIAGNQLSGYAWSGDLGWIDFSGVRIQNPPQCADGVDNADPEDTLADFGSGPTNDPGCTDANDDDETDGGATAPDLTVVSFTQSAGPYIKGAPINLTGVVQNSGTAPTPSGFHDNFTYSWDGGATWIPATGVTTDSNFDGSTNEVSNAVLNQGNQATDNKTYTPNQTGSLLLQYCTDSRGEIPEGVGEGNNCQTSAVITVVDGGGVICPAGTTNNCVLPNTPAGSTVSGSCAPGFSGSCEFICNDVLGSGNWHENSNSCVAGPVGPSTLPSIGRFQACDLGGGNCTSAKTVAPGTALQIEWDSTNADSCVPLAHPGDFVTNGNPDGTDNTITSPATPGVTETYRILCTKNGGNPVTASLTIRSSGPELTATPRIVSPGGQSQIEWTSTFAGCVLNGGGLVNIDATVPDFRTVTINGRTTFVLTCGGVERDRVTVEVVGTGFET